MTLMVYFKRAEFWHRTASKHAGPMPSSLPNGKCSPRPIGRSIEEASEQLLTFYEFPRTMWKSIRTTNALENLNREFRRRTKTQASFTTEASAVALLFGLVASGQIKLRRIDGYQHLADVLAQGEVAA